MLLKKRAYLNTIRSHKEELSKEHVIHTVLVSQCYLQYFMFVFCGCNSSHCHCCDVFLALRATPVRWLVTTSRCLSSFVRRGSRTCWRLCLLRRAPESAPTSKSMSFPEVQISISQPSTHSVTQCTNIFYRRSLRAHWNMLCFQTESEFGWWGGSSFR